MLSYRLCYHLVQAREETAWQEGGAPFLSMLIFFQIGSLERRERWEREEVMRVVGLGVQS